MGDTLIAHLEASRTQREIITTDKYALPKCSDYNEKSRPFDAS